EVLHRLFTRLQGQASSLALVEHAVLGVDAGGKRMRPQHARAEAVDGRHPGALGLAGELAVAELGEAVADAELHLRGGLVGERDREYAVGPGVVGARRA